MICPACSLENATETEECFGCGKALFALTQGSVLASRYEIRRPLGQGGMGKVYEAWDRVLSDRVAIKVLRPQFAREPEMARRFLLEIRLARRITHPNVCRLHEYGDSDGIRYLSMELVDGVNLKDVLRQRSLRTEEAYDVALAAAEGLAAVHAQGVIHRDFKTANIMLDGRGQVKVMDFGIAKEAGADTTGLSLAGQVLGTPEYMSPEHAQGGTVDFRSDLYALGCVIFEIFAGRALFQGTSPIDTLRRHLTEPADFSGGRGLLIPEPLVPVLTRALAKKPENRQPSVGALAEQLRAARDGFRLHAVLESDADLFVAPAASPLSSVAVDAPTPGAPSERQGDRRPTARASRSLVLGLAAVVLVALGVFAWRGPAPTPAVEPSTARAIGTPPPTTASAPTTTSLAAVPVAPPSPRGARPRPLLRAPVQRAAPPSTQAAAVEQPLELVPKPAPPSTQAVALETTPAQETGVLNLMVLPPSQVSIDGVSQGVVSSRAVSLPPGPHLVVFERTGYLDYRRTLTVRVGVATDFVMDWSEKGVRNTQ